MWRIRSKLVILQRRVESLSMIQVLNINGDGSETQGDFIRGFFNFGVN